MVSSVGSSTYYSYLSQLEGTASSSAASTATPVTTVSAAGTTAATASTAQNLVSSLLNGGSYSSSVLSLLQENSTGSFDPITSLLGGSGTNDGLTSLYSSLYDSVSAASFTQAQENSTPAAATTPQANSAENLINSETQASIAYNQTLQQNAANAVQTSVNSVKPIVA